MENCQEKIGFGQIAILSIKEIKYRKDLLDHGAIPIANEYNLQQRMALILRQKWLCRYERCGSLSLSLSCKAWQPHRFVGEGSVMGRWERRFAATRKPFGSLVRSVQIFPHLSPSSPAPPSRKKRQSCLCTGAHIIFIFTFFPCLSRYY